MPRFHIRPSNSSHPLAEYIVSDEAAVLHMVKRLDCKEAEVLRDEEYAFSIRLDENGLWTIFQRPGMGRGEVMSTFG